MNFECHQCQKLNPFWNKGSTDAVNIATIKKCSIFIFFRMYCNGLNPNIEMLYNPVSYPVCSGTPPLHTLCSWNHEEEWSVIGVATLV